MKPEAAEAVEQEREHLETLAESNLPAAWIGQALLDSADAAEGGATP